jgi:hypothetical protein
VKDIAVLVQRYHALPLAGEDDALDGRRRDSGLRNKVTHSTAAAVPVTGRNLLRPAGTRLQKLVILGRNTFDISTETYEHGFDAAGAQIERDYIVFIHCMKKGLRISEENS